VHPGTVRGSTISIAGGSAASVTRTGTNAAAVAGEDREWQRLRQIP